MSKASKNKFDVKKDIVYISHPDWDFIASASIKDEYIDELQSVTWSKNGNYLYSKKLGCYLHIYIMKMWYGEEKYMQMLSEGYVVDHMDNNGHNCHISNLCFLMADENKAKGLTVDKRSKEKAYVALSMFKDFSTEHIQLTIVFNYPAIAKVSTLNVPAVIELVYLLYDCEYELIINDARKILYDYRKSYSFEPEKLHHVDYHIEGAYGTPCPKEQYDRYVKGELGNTVAFMVRKAPIFGWKPSDKKFLFYLR